MFYAKVLHRSFHTATTNFVRRKANPGIGIQTQVFRREGVIQQEDEAEHYDDMESDFMEMHKTHKQHEQEMNAQREQMRRWVVKNKYFKEKNPNFLTYAEKEQIKLLYTRDPVDWTAEKLSDSFPATPEIIQKIIRSKWVARSAQRIKDHDEAVMDNWESLRKGKFFQLNPRLREHLTKFATRRKEDLKDVAVDLNARPALPRPIRSDFLSIITSCKPYADKEGNHTMIADTKNKTHSLPKMPTEEDEETFLSDKVKDKRKMRLQELKALKLRDDAKIQIEPPLKNPSGTGIVQTVAYDSMEKYATNEIVVSKEDMRKFEMAKIRERIYIPRKLRKEGATYKVEDCYYDDDGEFLYRVPGMTGKSV